MKILSAEFVASAVEPSQFPQGSLPEIAFAGRSNVGKSSLLNVLVGRRDLARVSQTPGRTRLINFFRISGTIGPNQQPLQFLLVDLPGYGYAKVSKAVQEQWGPMIERYLRERRSLRGLVVLTDIRRGESEEANLIRWAHDLGLAVVAVATKVDKMSRNERAHALRSLEAFLKVPVLGCCAVTGEGKDVVWKAVQHALTSPRKQPGDYGDEDAAG